VVEFALAWYLTVQTGSATVLATAMIVALLPQIVLGPIIGPFIDRWNRKKIMIIADLSIALMTVVLVVLFFSGAIQIWHIYIALVVRSIGQSFHFPAMQAAITMIVPEKHLTRAAGLGQMLGGIINIAGPPAGALLMQILPMQWVLAIDIITAIIAVGTLLFIAIPQPVKAVKMVATSIFHEMIDGFRYIWIWKGLRALVGLSAIISFFLIPPFTLLPIFVTRYLEGDVLKLGWLDSAFGFGIIAGGLILGAWGGFKNKIITCLWGVIISGVFTVLLGFTSLGLFLMGLAACFMIGLGLTFANGPIMAVLQTIVAKDMQGRVFSLMGSVGSAMSPLGLAIAGPLADIIGIRVLFFIAGTAVLLIALASLFLPSLMNLEKKNSN
jgi:DHA3 family macrolide efflux protein-like MFS transporter